MHKKALTLSLLMAASTLQASELSVGLSDSMVSLDYMQSTSKANLIGRAGYLHQTKVGQVASVGLTVSEKMANDTDASMGMKAVGIHQNNRLSMALALGGEVDFPLPSSTVFRINAQAWHAPSIVSYNRIENFTDLSVNLNLRLLQSSAFFVGYRYVRAQNKNSQAAQTVEGVQAGVRMIF